MKVELDYKILFVILLFCFLGKIELYVIFAISIICHEFIHMLIGCLIDAKTTSIYFGPIGMRINVAFYGKQNVLKKILFYISGPLINFLIAYFFSNYSIKITYINVALGIFNLFPILPLDGGNIILEILKVLIGRYRASEVMICFSKCFLFLVSIIYAAILVKVKNLYLVVLILYVWRLYFLEEEKWGLYKKARNCLKNIEIN